MIRRRSGILTALAILATALGACDGPGVVTPGGAPAIARTGVSSNSSAVTGTWRRAIFVIDEFDIARSIETTWQFGADGVATRVIVTNNFTSGLSDVLVATGQWRLEGSDIVIDVTTPSSFRLQLPLQLSGERLILSGETYFRVTS